MIVECPGCNTNFPVDPKKIPDGGVNARCSRCSEVFFIDKPEPRAEGVVPRAREHEPIPGPTEDAAGADAAWSAEATWGTEAEAAEAKATEEASPAVEPEAAWEPPPAAEPEAPWGAEAAAVEREAGKVPEEAAGPVPTFGKRDPTEKAKRLARVLVSDIILYNPDRHHQAMESGRIKEEFEEEIQKSWTEYLEQVGPEIADSTTFFNDALNEILAKGEDIF